MFTILNNKLQVKLNNEVYEYNVDKNIFSQFERVKNIDDLKKYLESFSSLTINDKGPLYKINEILYDNDDNYKCVKNMIIVQFTKIHDYKKICYSMIDSLINNSCFFRDSSGNNFVYKYTTLTKKEYEKIVKKICVTYCTYDTNALTKCTILEYIFFSDFGVYLHVHNYETDNIIEANHIYSLITHMNVTYNGLTDDFYRHITSNNDYCYETNNRCKLVDHSPNHLINLNMYKLFKTIVTNDSPDIVENYFNATIVNNLITIFRNESKMLSYEEFM